MLHNQHGSIYRVILGCFIGVAFAFALAWPQYAKDRNVHHLKQAVQLAKALAFAAQSYYQQHGAFVSEFKSLDVATDCPLSKTTQGAILDCPHYTYSLEGNLVKAAHKQLPVWLEVTLPEGAATCHYQENDWAGQDLCRRLGRI